MTSNAAFWLVPLLSIITSPVSAACNSAVSCLCGSSNNTYSLCIDAVMYKENPCNVWSHCKTCQENITQCATCPGNRTGPTCLEVKKIRKKRQYRRSGRQTIDASFFGSCPRLDSPDLGSISCRQISNFRSCTGRCLPGYSFVDSTQQQITLECHRGRWVSQGKARPSFPACISGGHCNLEIKVAGSFNCTTGMDGTRCDVICNGKYQGRYHCFPGRRWTPNLPYCAKPKGGSSSERPPPSPQRPPLPLQRPPQRPPRPPPCLCRNNGICGTSGNCICAKGWAGTYCDRKEERPSCPDPGFPSGGDRVTEDGTPAPYRSFSEGELLVFSCRGRDTALLGVSLIRCRANGTWSAPIPRCVRDPSVVCSDPGIVSNADRINTDGSPSTTDHVYTPGQSVVYSCRGGYSLRGSTIRTCLRNGQWSGSAPMCSRIRIVEKTCRRPDPDINGFIEDDPPRMSKYPPGTELMFRCDEGYRPMGKITLYCLSTGDWSSPPPTCEEIARSEPVTPPSNHVTCRYPGVDPNGKIEETLSIDPRRIFQRYLPGSEVTYTCRDGYVLNGQSVIFCLRSGEWSSSAPTCTRPDGSENHRQNCRNVEPANNRIVLFDRWRPEDVDEDEPEEDDSNFPPGTHLHFSCEDGFIIIGSNNLVCGSTGYWNADAPICIEDCGRSLTRTRHKLTGASSTVVGEWPWMVAVKNHSSLICGGALINNQTVLTAAHCVNNYPFFTLSFGKYYRDDKKDDRKVEKRRTTQIIIHKDFDKDTFDNDIALLRFEPSVVYSDRIKPICLPTPNSTAKNVIPGKTGSVTGWGFNENKLLSEELMMAQLPIQPDEECTDAYEEHGLGQDMHPGMFCAGHTEGVENTCRGDSGSPLVFLDGGTHRHTIEGLVSFGKNNKACDEPRAYTVFTKVGRYMGWILANFAP